jgi:hypothetical protein
VVSVRQTHCPSPGESTRLHLKLHLVHLGTKIKLSVPRIVLNILLGRRCNWLGIVLVSSHGFSMAGRAWAGLSIRLRSDICGVHYSHTESYVPSTANQLYIAHLFRCGAQRQVLICRTDLHLSLSYADVCFAFAALPVAIQTTAGCHVLRTIPYSMPPMS